MHVKIFKVIKNTVAMHWPKIDYFGDVLLVITVPSEFSEKSKAILRKCVFDGELINKEDSINLRFTIERKNLHNSHKTKIAFTFFKFLIRSILLFLFFLRQSCCDILYGKLS